ncbi:MAG: hypothetical protein JO236_17210 [Mycobacterium sp.]|uniref:hypothetical protein n=1 Tax=Mycobacterium sp. TaxID=1785 RepID=UPI001EC95305|nr:hypothetical protein [Mycobacterium sp.]MBW0019269.1 hypothetical protein [Mycobacterium sp.]
MPSPEPVVSRRGVLAGGATLGVLGALAGAVGLVSACGERTPASKQSTVEELRGPFDQARSDSALATAAAGAVGLAPQIAAALTVVATQRAAHATTLAAEIFRVAGRGTSTSESSSASAAATSTEPAPPPPAVSDVINALRTSADSATRLVATTSGYRAGLLGSIAASCMASYTVALVPGGPSI